MKLVLIFLIKEGFASGSFEVDKWSQIDKRSRAIIGLSLLDDTLDHVWVVAFAKELLDNTTNVFKRQTYLDKLRARRGLCIAEIKSREKVLSNFNKIQQEKVVLKLTRVDFDSFLSKLKN